MKKPGMLSPFCERRGLLSALPAVLTVLLLSGQFFNCCRLNGRIGQVFASLLSGDAALPVEKTAAFPSCHGGPATSVASAPSAASDLPAGPAWGTVPGPQIRTPCACAHLMAAKPPALVETAEGLLLPLFASPSRFEPHPHPALERPAALPAPAAAAGPPQPVYLKTLRLLV